jgi:hypothetical protein
MNWKYIVCTATPLCLACGGDRAAERADPRSIEIADTIRAGVLRMSEFAGFQDSCARGELRTFPTDSMHAVPRWLSQLERLVLSRGADAPLNNARGRALVRATVRLETGGPGPRWDVAEGDAPRAINPYLSIRVLNPLTGECVDAPGKDPYGILLPELKRFDPPRDSGSVQYVAGYGPDALKEMRDFFYSRAGKDNPDTVMRYVNLTAFGIWGPYAIVSVTRGADRQGAIPMKEEESGAVYAFHWINDEWRLLGIVRTWQGAAK